MSNAVIKQLETIKVKDSDGLVRERYADARNIGPESFLNIMPFMIRELRLKGADLLIYAAAYAFAREHSNRVSRAFAAEIAGVNLRTVRRCVTRLVENGLLVKFDGEHLETVPLEQLRERAVRAVSVGEDCPVAYVPLDPINPHLYDGERVGPMHGFIVYGWMTHELGLSGSRLLVYAYISSFTRDGTGGFLRDGFTDFPLSHIVSTLGCSLTTVKASLDDLRQLSYIETQMLGVSSGGRRVRLRAVPLAELRKANVNPGQIRPSAFSADKSDLGNNIVNNKKITNVITNQPTNTAPISTSPSSGDEVNNTSQPDWSVGSSAPVLPDSWQHCLAEIKRTSENIRRLDDVPTILATLAAESFDPIEVERAWRQKLSRSSTGRYAPQAAKWLESDAPDGCRALIAARQRAIAAHLAEGRPTTEQSEPAATPDEIATIIADSPFSALLANHAANETGATL